MLFDYNKFHYCMIERIIMSRMSYRLATTTLIRVTCRILMSNKNAQHENLCDFSLVTALYLVCRSGDNGYIVFVRNTRKNAKRDCTHGYLCT